MSFSSASVYFIGFIGLSNVINRQKEMRRKEGEVGQKVDSSGRK
jgi:hypothetical protein